MRLSKNFEESVFVLLILATQKGHAPIKSSRLSELLEVSDSSLKKTLRKLVVADLVTSSASKDGGFTLKRSVDTISLSDVLTAVDEKVLEFRSSGLAQKLFPNKKHVVETENRIDDVLQNGQAALLKELEKTKLSSLLEEGVFQNGVLDWIEP